MSTPHITLTIEQARTIREALDVAKDSVDWSGDVQDKLELSAKIMSDELECLRYL